MQEEQINTSRNVQQAELPGSLLVRRGFITNNPEGRL
jgi:hypothetical protein